MPTATLVPTGTDSNTLRLGGTAGTYHDGVATDDADTKYVHSLVGEDRNGQGTHAGLPGAAGSVNSANNLIKCKMDGPAGDGLVYNWDGDSWNSNGPIAVTGYTNYQNDHDAARLTVALINSDTIGCRLQGQASRGVRCTYARRSVNYELVMGGYTFLLQILTPVLGGALSVVQMGQMPDIGRWTTFLDSARRTQIRPDEYSRCLREWREYRHPSFFQMPEVA